MQTMSLLEIMYRVRYLVSSDGYENNQKPFVKVFYLFFFIENSVS
jgi:hypothetical protein